MAPHPTGNRRSMIIAAAVILTVVAIAYWGTWSAPFVYDDALAIPQNPTIRHLWPIWDVLMPHGQSGLTVSGRPVLNLSFALNYAISGTSPWSYHVVNLLIHAGAGLLLYGIVRRTLAGRSSREAPRAMGPHGKAGWTIPDSANAALLIAVLWVAHPLATQAVTYTVQRAESLMGFFHLLTVYAFVRAVDANKTSGASGPKHSVRWLALSIGACGLGMATKEVMATAPLLVLLYDRAFVSGTFRSAVASRRGYYAALAATWVLLGLLVLSTGGNRGGTVGIGTGVPWWAYGLTQFHAVARYLALSVWPSPLIFEYGTFWVARTADILPYMVIVVPLLLATLLALYRSPALGFCGAWFFLILAPTSLAPGTLQMIVEHRTYLSLAAVITVLAVAVIAIAGRTGQRLLWLAVLGLVVLTIERNQDYRSHLALWGDTVAKRPDNPRARIGLAEAFEELGRTDEAIAQRTEVIRLQPSDARQHYNAGVTLAGAGRYDAAIREYELALRLDPMEANTHNNLAIAFGRTGRLEEALAQYRKAVRLKPADQQFHYNYGVSLLRAGRDTEAHGEFSAALQLEPANADAHFNLGAALVRLKRVEEAVVHYAEALRLKPDDPEFRSTLARAHAERADELLDGDRVAEAAAHYESAVRLAPEDAIAHHNLGVTYARLERWADAQREFEAALRLKRDYAEAQRHLRQLQTLLGH